MFNRPKPYANRAWTNVAPSPVLLGANNPVPTPGSAVDQEKAIAKAKSRGNQGTTKAIRESGDGEIRLF
jgi:hypothetical protein